MKKIITLVSLLALSGCATAAAPVFYQGNYYMAGDKNCENGRKVSNTRILCADKKNNPTGYRDAMTSQQIQMYQFRQAQKAASYAAVSQSLNSLNQSLQQSTYASQQNTKQFGYPLVQPTSPYGSSGVTSYTQVGGSLLSSNGTTYRKVGSTMIGSDGTACRTVGSTVICN